MPAMPVKWFRQSTMGGAPQLGETTEGTFIAQLKAFLITGFNDQTPSTATYADGVVTLIFGSAHGFVPYQVIEVTGATEAQYNGTFRVVTIHAATFTLTYVPDATPPASTTGVLNVRQPEVGGWEIIYDDPGTFVTIFGRTHPDATPYYLRLHNSNAYQGGVGTNAWWAKADVITNYVDENTYDVIQTFAWPASNRYRGAGGESWLFADDRMFYHLVNYATSSATCTVLQFGDMNSIIPGDKGHCMTTSVAYDFVGTTTEWDRATDSIRNYFPRNNQASYRTIMTQYHNLPGTIAWYSWGLCTNWGTLLAHPNAANNGMMLSTQPLMILENGVRGVTLRGFLPGLLEPLNESTTMNGQVTSGHPGIEATPVQWVRATNHVHNQETEAPRSFVIRLDKWRDQVG